MEPLDDTSFLVRLGLELILHIYMEDGFKLMCIYYYVHL